MTARHLRLMPQMQQAQRPPTTDEAWAAVVSLDQRHALELLDQLAAAVATYEDPAAAADDLRARHEHAVSILNVVFDSAAQQIRRRCAQ